MVPVDAPDSAPPSGGGPVDAGRSTPPAGPDGKRPRREANLRIGRFFGVPIYFAPSWLLIAAFLTVYYVPVIRDLVDGVSSSTAYALALTFAVLFALCVLAHELGHTAVSLLLGHKVRRIVIFLLGGVSEIESEPTRPRDELLIAVAGPLVSVVIALGTLGGLFVVESHTAPWVLLALLFGSNATVAIFNLLPGLPLDGGRVLRAAVWAVARNKFTGTRAAAWSGRAVAVLVAIVTLVIDRQSWGFAASIIGLLMAAYLWVGATQSLRAANLFEHLPQIRLERFLRPGVMLPADLSVAEALRRAWDHQARGLVVLDSADHPQAIVDEARISAVPVDRRPWTSVTSVARPLEPGLILPVTLAGEALLEALQNTPANEYLVVNADGSPAGIVASSDLVSALTAATRS